MLYPLRSNSAPCRVAARLIFVEVGPGAGSSTSPMAVFCSIRRVATSCSRNRGTPSSRPAVASGPLSAALPQQRLITSLRFKVRKSWSISQRYAIVAARHCGLPHIVPSWLSTNLVSTAEFSFVSSPHFATRHRHCIKCTFVEDDGSSFGNALLSWLPHIPFKRRLLCSKKGQVLIASKCCQLLTNRPS